MHIKQGRLFGDKLMSRSDEGKSNKRSRLDGDQEVGLIYASRTGNTGEVAHEDTDFKLSAFLGAAYVPSIFRHHV
ncbi:unnamed protein product [Prunus armeniaca]